MDNRWTTVGSSESDLSLSLCLCLVMSDHGLCDALFFCYCPRGEFFSERSAAHVHLVPHARAPNEVQSLSLKVKVIVETRICARLPAGPPATEAASVGPTPDAGAAAPPPPTGAMKDDAKNKCVVCGEARSGVVSFPFCLRADVQIPNALL